MGGGRGGVTSACLMSQAYNVRGMAAVHFVLVITRPFTVQFKLLSPEKASSHQGGNDASPHPGSALFFIVV